MEDVEKILLETPVTPVIQEAFLNKYENCILVSKTDLNHFIKIVEPLTKASVDSYGKVVKVSSLNTDIVELSYSNHPYRAVGSFENKSGKTIEEFCINLALLKKVANDAISYVAFVQDEKGDFNFVVCDSLMFLETISLDFKEYEFTKAVPKNEIDALTGWFLFKKLGPVLSTAERSSEKNIIVKDDFCYIFTGLFAAKVSSPFGANISCLLYKAAVEIIASVMEASTTSVAWEIIKGVGNTPDKMAVAGDGSIYVEFPISTYIDDFYSHAVAKSLSFEANVIIINDSIGRLLSVVNSLDYLSKEVVFDVHKKDIKMKIKNSTQTKESVHKFDLEGEPQAEVKLKVMANIMKAYLNCAGDAVKYQFTENGFCFEGEQGSKFIIRSGL